MTPRRKQPSPPLAKWPKVSRNTIIAGGLVLIVLVWALWPSRLSRVKNLGARGSAVIAFGDSLTAGYGAAAGEDYPSRLSQRIETAVVNVGVNGDTTETAMARLEDDVLSRNPRIVIVGLGGNDFLRGIPISSTEENLRAIVRTIHGRGAMVILLGFSFPSFSSDYESMYEEVARSEGCLLIDEVLDGILTDAALKSDGIHPNARGYALMAERVSGPLEKLIRKADESP